MTPQQEIERLKRDYLDDENAEFFKFDLAFSVARCIVKYNDPDLLEKMPAWVGEMILELCESYRTHGRYTIVSNLGEADHSEMVGKLAQLMEKK